MQGKTKYFVRIMVVVLTLFSKEILTIEFLNIFMICWHMFLQIPNFRKVAAAITNCTFKFFFFYFIFVCYPARLAFMSLLITKIGENLSTELTRNRSSSGCAHIWAVVGQFGFLFWWWSWASACGRRLCWLCGWGRLFIVHIRLLVLRNYQGFPSFSLELDIMNCATVTQEQNSWVQFQITDVAVSVCFVTYILGLHFNGRKTVFTWFLGCHTFLQSDFFQVHILLFFFILITAFFCFTFYFVQLWTWGRFLFISCIWTFHTLWTFFPWVIIVGFGQGDGW